MCCNSGDPQKHFLRLLFPGCKPAFLKDVWHGIEIVKRETAGFAHQLHEGFVQELWHSILKWEATSEAAAYAHFKTYHKDGKLYNTKEAAMEAMYKIPRYKESIYNFIDIKDRERTAKRIEKVYETTKAMDLQYAAEAKAEGRAYKHFFQRAIPSMKQAGTEAAINNLLEHIRKGCFADPLPPFEMSYKASNKPHKDGGPPLLKRRRGPNTVELDNLHSNRRSVGYASRQRSSLTHKRLLLYVSEHNLMCDRNIEHITGKKARPRDWYTREALQEDMGQLTGGLFDDGMEYPPPINLSECMEPIGELYQLHNQWERDDIK